MQHHTCKTNCIKSQILLRHKHLYLLLRNPPQPVHVSAKISTRITPKQLVLALETTGKQLAVEIRRSQSIRITASKIQ